jgi:type I restriction enzyme S subunit
MRYVSIPKEISSKRIEENNYCLSPAKYLDFHRKSSVNYKTLDKLIVTSQRRRKLKKSESYHYYEIGSINVESGFIEGKNYYGISMPAESPLEVLTNDIVISTVRTYRRGIGIITDNADNLTCTPAILLIREVKEVTKDYLLALLRSDLFIEQIIAFENRGLYPRFDTDAISNIFIPIPKNEETIKYISILQRAAINKEREIRRKHNQIHALIRRELEENQKPNKFVYEFPDYKEVVTEGRLDAGIYTKAFKEIDFLINNYSRGFYFIAKNKISSGSTPSLRFISSEIKQLKYKWITPTVIDDFGNLQADERINMKEENNLSENAMLLINRTSKGGRGEYVGIACFYDANAQGVAHHNQGIYRVFDYSDVELCFMTCFMNHKLMREYCAGLSVGSKMKEIKSNQFIKIPFPNFPNEKQKEIAVLYHNAASRFETDELTLDNFADADDAFNQTAGIVELDKSAKQIKARIDEVIDQIVKDEAITINFEFLIN